MVWQRMNNWDGLARTKSWPPVGHRQETCVQIVRAHSSFVQFRRLSSTSNLCQTVLTVPIPIPFKSFSSITVSFCITTIHTIKTKGNACNAHSMRIWAFTLWCALASMRIRVWTLKFASMKPPREVVSMHISLADLASHVITWYN